MKKTIYLSPHLDDAVLSCGAIIWDQVHTKEEAVEVWTICAGDPPPGPLFPFAAELHARWQTSANTPQARRAEDAVACKALGCLPVHLEFPDCIYRSLPGSNQPRINANPDLFEYDESKDEALVGELGRLLQQSLTPDCQLLVPLGVGGHIDHQITRKAAELLSHPLWYYADYPYAGGNPEKVQERANGKSAMHFPLTDAGLHAWQAAVSAYTSQVSSFWPSLKNMKEAIEEYARSEFGNTLWTDMPK